MPYRALALALALLALVPAAASAAVDRTKPTTPGNLRVTAVTANSVSLAWNPSTDNSGTFAYYVKDVGTGGVYWVPQTQTSLTRTGLQPNKAYRYVVYAQDTAGNKSANSNQVTVSTPAAQPAAVPANVRVVSRTPTTIGIAWDASANAVRYDVSHNGTIWWSTPPSYTATWLVPGTSQTFLVRAINGAGVASAWSAPLVTSTVPDNDAPTTPGNLTGTAVSPSQLRISWSPSTDDVSGVSYNVYVDGKPSVHMLPVDELDTKIDIFNLRAGTTYDITVRAYDSSGNLSVPAQLSIATASSTDTTPPPAPTNLVYGQLTPHSVHLGWGPWSGFGDTFAHEIWMDGAFLRELVGDWRYSGQLFPGGQVRHIAPGSTHTFTARNRDEAGNLSAHSNAVTIAFPASSDTTPPTAATSLSGDTSPNCAFAFFSWAGGSGGNDVEIYEDGHFLDVWRDEAFMTSFGRHSYTVRYVDLAGNTSPDSPATILDHGMRC